MGGDAAAPDPDPNPKPSPDPNPDSKPEDDRNPNPDPKPEDGRKPQAPKRRLIGNPDPEAEVIALSPRTLLSHFSFKCEVCGKEFRREQNLTLHRRGHHIPTKLTKRPEEAPPPRKRVYVCPVETCVYHSPGRALGDLTGIKKHYSRKHGEKKWECDKCKKKYAVRTDWKAHTKTCGTRKYECRGCHYLFSRKDSYLTHRAACEATATAAAAAEESEEEDDEEGEEEEESEEEDEEWAPSESEAGQPPPPPPAVDHTGFSANVVNSELLFPSLWGHMPMPIFVWGDPSAPPPPPQQMPIFVWGPAPVAPPPPPPPPEEGGGKQKSLECRAKRRECRAKRRKRSS